MGHIAVIADSSNQSIVVDISETSDSYLDPFYRAIDEASYILDLEENWDDMGGCIYTKDTFQKACTFLLDFVKSTYDMCGISKIPSPKILPGPDGNIDILWKNDKFKVLIEVYKDMDIVKYYGENIEGEEEEGTINLSVRKSLPSLIYWMVY